MECRGKQEVEGQEVLRKRQNFTGGYPASRGFSLAWLLAFTKSFASLVSHVISLFRPGSVYKRGTSVRRVTEGSHLPEKSAKGIPTELINEKFIIIRSKFWFLFIGRESTT